VRTGAGFNAYDAQAAGTVPVCRFFTTPGHFGTRSSHFYTADADECAGLKFNPDWIYEKIAFYIAVPTAGVCPAGTLPVYRAYNHGQTGAPNHRFTTSLATYNQFTTQLGWDPEGIRFCAPP
jgi:serine protease